MKIIKQAEAARLIQDGWTVCTSGFVGAGHPEALSVAIEERFLREAKPRNLTLLYAAGQGDRDTRGAGHFGHEGLLKRVVGGHWGAAPRLGALAVQNKIEAYNWPQGVIAQLFRAIAGNKPGIVSKIGLHTFIDPRHDGGKLSARTTENLVELITLRGEEYLFYPSMPIHCALIRGTSADARGNISCEEEAFHNDVLAIAQAAHNSGGIVIAQVKNIVEAGTLNPNAVRVPGILVDYVVQPDNPEHHWQTYGEDFNPTYTGARRAVDGEHPITELNARKIIQRRAFFELQKLDNPVGNLGTGIPAGVGEVAREEGHKNFTLTIESGPIGGTPSGNRLSFGASTNPECIVDQASQFDFYDGGGLDISFLGMAEVDVHGNVNVSRFGDRISGVGGFVNISQTAKQVVFMGTFTAGGLGVKTGNGKLEIAHEGRKQKVVPSVEHLSFNGPYSTGQGVKVLYITERAVFELRDGKLTLTEIAPGMDLQHDILAHCAKDIVVADDVKLMDARIFRDEKMTG
ncbi:MAG: CoA-transferase [Pseudomonadota bacterium]|jgi:propionate CoA-transferase